LTFTFYRCTHCTACYVSAPAPAYRNAAAHPDTLRYAHCGSRADCCTTRLHAHTWFTAGCRRLLRTALFYYTHHTAHPTLSQLRSGFTNTRTTAVAAYTPVLRFMVARFLYRYLHGTFMPPRSTRTHCHTHAATPASSTVYLHTAWLWFYPLLPHVLPTLVHVWFLILVSPSPSCVSAATPPHVYCRARMPGPIVRGFCFLQFTFGSVSTPPLSHRCRARVRFVLGFTRMLLAHTATLVSPPVYWFLFRTHTHHSHLNTFTGFLPARLSLLWFRLSFRIRRCLPPRLWTPPPVRTPLRSSLAATATPHAVAFLNTVFTRVPFTRSNASPLPLLHLHASFSRAFLSVPAHKRLTHHAYIFSLLVQLRTTATGRDRFPHWVLWFFRTCTVRLYTPFLCRARTPRFTAFMDYTALRLPLTAPATASRHFTGCTSRTFTGCTHAFPFMRTRLPFFSLPHHLFSSVLVGPFGRFLLPFVLARFMRAFLFCLTATFFTVVF